MATPDIVEVVLDPVAIVEVALDAVTNIVEVITTGVQGPRGDTATLASIYNQISEDSGGPPYPGAFPQAFDGLFLWSALLGSYLYLDNGIARLALDDGSLILT